MTLALLLTAVTGAWAQTAFGVKEITADMLPKSWSTDNSAVTADDLAQFAEKEGMYLLIAHAKVFILALMAKGFSSPPSPASR